MATHSGILAWEISWTERDVLLQSHKLHQSIYFLPFLPSPSLFLPTLFLPPRLPLFLHHNGAQSHYVTVTYLER